ncbi:MAG: putative Fe-S cluster assembly protein SufT, partial [Luteimonas sp.]
GGSYTVFVEGNLFRIAGRDADAIGKEPPQALELPPGASDEDVEQIVWKQLRTCFDPEIPINVVDLGLVYEAVIHPRDDGRRDVEVKMTLTAPGCGMGDILIDDVRSKLELIPTVAEADVELVFDPPWNRTMMSEAARLETGML